MHTVEEFDNKFSAIFPGISFDSLADSPWSKLRFNMGEALHGEDRVNQVLFRCESIFSAVFDKKDDVWIRLRIWKSHEHEEVDFISSLQKANIDKNILTPLSLNYTYNGVECLILLKAFSYKHTEPILRAICNYELGLEPFLHATAYFVRLERSPCIVNLYDDRGLDLVVKDISLLTAIEERFGEWVLSRIIG